MTRNHAATLALTLGVLAAPLAAEAQQGAKVVRVGVVFHAGLPGEAGLEGLREGLKKLRLEDGRNIVLVVRDPKGDVTAAEAAAKDLEREGVGLIVAFPMTVALAVKRATAHVPIVFTAGGDPVAAGLVDRIAKPGGRLTGVHSHMTDVTAKRLETLKDILPTLRSVVTFYSPDNPMAPVAAQSGREAARQLGIAFVERHVASPGQVRDRLQALRPEEADAYFFVSDGMVNAQAERILERARAVRMPAMVYDTDLVARGALVGYGTGYRELGRVAATYVHRILGGAHPEDLPVESVSRLELAINLKTARALGLTVPRSILSQADRVIQ